MHYELYDAAGVFIVHTVRRPNTSGADGRRDAKQHVADHYSDDAIVSPRYHGQALEQMGWQLSYGQRKAYRQAFTAAFVEAWQARERAITARRSTLDKSTGVR